MRSIFPRMSLGIAVMVVLTGTVAGPLAAQTIMEKAARDETATVADTDPAMAGAMRKAQATLADFLTLAATPRPGTGDFAVKVAVREGERAEFFWITPFTDGGEKLSGEINNTPRVVHSVKLGQTIAFTRSDIVDWMYIENGKMKGNYTACALLKTAPEHEAEEFKKHFGLNCDS